MLIGVGNRGYGTLSDSLDSSFDGFFAFLPDIVFWFRSTAGTLYKVYLRMMWMMWMVVGLLTELTYLQHALTLNREKWWKECTTAGDLQRALTLNWEKWWKECTTAGVDHIQNGHVIQIVTHLAQWVWFPTRRNKTMLRKIHGNNWRLKNLIKSNQSCSVHLCSSR